MQLTLNITYIFSENLHYYYTEPERISIGGVTDKDVC